VTQSRLEHFGQALFLLGGQEFIDEGGGVVKAHPTGLATGGNSQPSGDVGFSAAIGIPS
jgi:hypothetical protein